MTKALDTYSSSLLNGDGSRHRASADRDSVCAGRRCRRLLQKWGHLQEEHIISTLHEAVCGQIALHALQALYLGLECNFVGVVVLVVQGLSRAARIAVLRYRVLRNMPLVHGLRGLQGRRGLRSLGLGVLTVLTRRALRPPTPHLRRRRLGHPCC